MANLPSVPEICQRIAEVRRERYGERGKSSFAKDLGISPSTYNYYESSRIPPAEVLVRISDSADVDLRWLLTGRPAAVPVPGGHPAVARVARLLADHPKAAEPLAAFVEILAASLAWPAKPAQVEPGREADVPGGEVRPAATAAAPATPPPAPGSAPVPSPTEGWIPILGRTAAGVPQFWTHADEASGVTLLSDMVQRYARRSDRSVHPAVAQESPGGAPEAVQIVVLARPDEDNVAEFLAAGGLKQRHPDAFAVRVDGDSMAPEFRHGDVVVCSPSVPAADGAPALVQLTGQIGVTCKIFRREGERVHLVPVNEQYPPQAFPAGRVAWAKRVLARVRSAV